MGILHPMTARWDPELHRTRYPIFSMATSWDTSNLMRAPTSCSTMLPHSKLAVYTTLNMNNLSYSTFTNFDYAVYTDFLYRYFITITSSIPTGGATGSPPVIRLRS
ncbi:hypothetical protein AX14_006514 [Amanita brunnescens Koide BX004]|nr:hypothetical protein AX14_006514 [Amanita brunnescens Koide BX004]